MIKECPVIKNNSAITVVKFGDTEVQFSSIMKDAKSFLLKKQAKHRKMRPNQLLKMQQNRPQQLLGK